MSHPAIAPLGEARSNVEVFRALAQAMGFTEPCFAESVDQMIDSALASGSPTLTGITRERLEAEGHVRLHLNGSSPTTKDQRPTTQPPTTNDQRPTTPFLPFAEGEFPTASGKAELYSAALAAQGIDPIASFVPPRESRHTEVAKQYPLELLGRKADNYLNSTFSNLPSLQAMEEDGLLEIHTADAAARGISEGAAVRVFNDRGSITLKARVNGGGANNVANNVPSSVPRGVVAARLKWAKLSPEKQNINVLTSERLTDIGRGATFYSCLVEVSLA